MGHYFFNISGTDQINPQAQYKESDAGQLPFVIGRKAWLFSDTPAGAHASAVIYSLVQTAKANGMEPYAWLRRVLRDLPAANSVEAVEALLPWNLRIPEISTKTES